MCSKRTKEAHNMVLMCCLFYRWTSEIVELYIWLDKDLLQFQQYIELLHFDDYRCSGFLVLPLQHFLNLESGCKYHWLFSCPCRSSIYSRNSFLQVSLSALDRRSPAQHIQQSLAWFILIHQAANFVALRVEQERATPRSYSFGWLLDVFTFITQVRW